MKILNGGIQVVCELTKENIWRLQGEGKLFGSLMCMYVGVAYFVNEHDTFCPINAIVRTIKLAIL